MTDNKLRGRAAQAAGIFLMAPPGWDPIENDADAFRLANVQLPMAVEHWGGLVRVRAFQVRPEVLVSVPFDAEEERGAATRRAITMAAAEVHRRQEEAETAGRKG